MSNLNLVCSQISFDVPIAHIGEGQIFNYDYFAVRQGDFGVPLLAKYEK